MVVERKARDSWKRVSSVCKCLLRTRASLLWGLVHPSCASTTPNHHLRGSTTHPQQHTFDEVAQDVPVGTCKFQCAVAFHTTTATVAFVVLTGHTEVRRSVVCVTACHTVAVCVPSINVFCPVLFCCCNRSSTSVYFDLVCRLKIRMPYWGKYNAQWTHRGWRERVHAASIHIAPGRNECNQSWNSVRGGPTSRCTTTNTTRVFTPHALVLKQRSMHRHMAWGHCPVELVAVLRSALRYRLSQLDGVKIGLCPNATRHTRIPTHSMGIGHMRLQAFQQEQTRVSFVLST